MTWSNCLRETVDGLGRSMCSHRRQCGICVSHSVLHCKARGVYVLETTWCGTRKLIVSIYDSPVNVVSSWLETSFFFIS
jgi:hypothetical protein